MNATERNAIQKIIENQQYPSAPGTVYDLGEDQKLHRTEVPPLVRGIENHNLLNSEEYKAGWMFCHHQYEQLLQFFLTATTKELRRFAGKAPRKPKGPRHDQQPNA